MARNTISSVFPTQSHLSLTPGSKKSPLTQKCGRRGSVSSTPTFLASLPVVPFSLHIAPAWILRSFEQLHSNLLMDSLGYTIAYLLLPNPLSIGDLSFNAMLAHTSLDCIVCSYSTVRHFSKRPHAFLLGVNFSMAYVARMFVNRFLTFELLPSPHILPRDLLLHQLQDVHSSSSNCVK